jgi:hypothetical protein
MNLKGHELNLSQEILRAVRSSEDGDDDTIDTLLEPIRNPVTGEIHRAIIELPEGFEATRMNQTSTKTLSVSTNSLKFRYEGT